MHRKQGEFELIFETPIYLADFEETVGDLEAEKELEKEREAGESDEQKAEDDKTKYLINQNREL